MSVICGINLSLAKDYSKYTLTTKVDGKKHKVYFKLQCSAEELQECIQICSKRKDIVYIELQGDISTMNDIETSGVQINYVQEVGNNLTEHDIMQLVEDIPSGVVPVIHLPKDFNNLELISSLSKEFPRVRFFGGNLFRLDNLHLGNYDKALLDSKGVKCNNFSYLTENNEDLLGCYNIQDLEFEFNERSEKEVKDAVSKPKKEKTKKPSSSRFAVTGFSLGDF